MNTKQETLDHPFTLCVTRQDVQLCVEEVRKWGLVAFDCEGENLGSVGGSLSIMACCIIPTQQVFLIDVLTLCKSDLDLFFDILKDQLVRKIVWDGRLDQSELFHGHRVKMVNCLDIQLGDVLSRKKRGQVWEDHVNRLVQRKFASWELVYARPSIYGKIHCLLGLEQAAVEHGICVDVHRPSEVDHRSWLKRPLPQTLLEYSASDVVIISSLYNHFVEHSYIDLTTLRMRSANYLNFHLARRRDPNNRFMGHPLLPLEILSPCPSSEMKVTCKRCARVLGRFASFSPDELPGEEICHVCTVVSWRMLHRQLERLGREIWAMKGKYSESAIRSRSLLKDLETLSTHPLSPFSATSKRDLLKHGPQILSRAIYARSEKLQIGHVKLSLISLDHKPPPPLSSRVHPPPSLHAITYDSHPLSIPPRIPCTYHIA